MLSCESNKTFMQIKTREEEERKRRDFSFKIQNKNFYFCEFLHA